MTHEIVINGCLPGMNQYIDVHRYASYKDPKKGIRMGNAMKQNAQKLCMWHIRQQMNGKTAKYPVRLHYIFYEKNRRRDLDNVSGFAHKVFQDALVKQGVLPGDGWKYITGYTDTFAVDKDHPRIVVMIEEVTT